MSTHHGTQLREVEQQKITARRAAYWKKLEPAARRDGSSLTPKNASELMDLAQAIGKRSEDIEQDIALLMEFESLRNADGDLVKALVALREVAKACAAKRAEAQRLAERVDAMRREADNSEHAARATEKAARQASVRLAELKRLLAEASHPDSQSEVAGLQRAARVESLESAVRCADDELRAMTQDQLDVDRRAHSQMHDLLRRRASAAAELAQLGITVSDAPTGHLTPGAPVPNGWDPLTPLRPDAEAPLNGLTLAGAPGPVSTTFGRGSKVTIYEED